MQRALDSAIGLPRRPTSASWMLVFLIPAEVSRSFMIPLLYDLMGSEKLLQSPFSHRYTLSARSDTYGLRQVAREKAAAGSLFHPTCRTATRTSVFFSYVNCVLELHVE